MNWLALVAGLVSIVQGIISALASQKLVDGALATRLSLHLQKAKAEILDAQGIRDTVANRPVSSLREQPDGLFRD